MKRIIWIYGLISASVCIIMMTITTALFYKMEGKGDPDIDKWQWLGYTTIILSFVLIYFAQVSYRDKYGGGHISYGKAFKIGILITLISSVIYVLGWLVTYYNFMPDFMDRYSELELRKLNSSGKSAAYIAEHTKQIEKYKEMYKSPIMIAGMTFLEPSPVGLIATIISSFLVRLKKRQPRTV